MKRVMICGLTTYIFILAGLCNTASAQLCSTVVEALVVDDFEDENIDGWIAEPAGWWGALTPAINGSYSLRPSTSVTSQSSQNTISYALFNSHLGEGQLTWRYQIGYKVNQSNGGGNSNYGQHGFYLMSNTGELLSGSPSGYVLGAGFDGGSDEFLTFYSVDAGTASPLFVTDYEVDVNFLVGVEVTRESDGTWEIKLDEGGGFDNLVSYGTFTDNTHNDFSHIGIDYRYTTSQKRKFFVDDILVSRTGCANTYYSQQSGDGHDAIWATSPSGTPDIASFNPNSNFIIQSGHHVILSQDAQMLDLEVYADGSLDMSNRFLCLSGDLSLNGAFTADDSELRFVGIGNHTISGVTSPTFNRLVLDCGGTINMNEASIESQFLVLDGNVYANGVITLLASADRTGSIGPLPDDSVFEAEVTLQTIVPSAGSNGLMNLTCPLQNVNVSDWQDDFLITGLPNSYPGEFSSMRYYDETMEGQHDSGFVKITTLDNIDPQQGYLLYTFASGIELEVTGAIQRGDFSFPLSYSDFGAPVDDGYNLIPNVYPSQVDFNAISDISVGIDSYSVYDGNKRSYASYNAATGLGDAPRYISSAQSFWVQANAADQQLNFSEQVKSNQIGGFYREVEAISSLGVTLAGHFGEESVYLGLKNGASIDFDPKYDVRSMSQSSSAYIAINNPANDAMKIQTIGRKSAGQSIPLYIKAPAGDYTLQLHDYQWIESYCVYLQDHTTGEIYALENGLNIPFTTEAALDGERFFLHFTEAIELNSIDPLCYAQATGSAIAKAPSFGSWNYSWYNAEGNEIVNETSSTESVLEAIPAGNYFVEIAHTAAVCPSMQVSIQLSDPLEHSPVIERTTNAWTNDAMVRFDMHNADEYAYTLTYETDIVSEGFTNGIEEIILPSIGTYSLTLNSGCGKWTEEITYEEVLAVDDQDNESFYDFTVDASFLTVFLHATRSQASVWSLFDVNGKLVDEKTIDSNTNSFNMPISQLNGGIYLLRCQHGTSFFTTKIMLQ